MTKSTMGNKLPLLLVENMRIVGEQIKLARLRRNLSITQIAERATCSPLTVARVEKGAVNVVIGIYLRVLYALQLDTDLDILLSSCEEYILPKSITQQIIEEVKEGVKNSPFVF